MGESVDIDEIEFFTDSEVESLTASIVPRDAPESFSLYPVPVSQCHLIGRNTLHVNRRKLFQFEETLLLLIRNYAGLR